VASAPSSKSRRARLTTASAAAVSASRPGFRPARRSPRRPPIVDDDVQHPLRIAAEHDVARLVVVQRGEFAAHRTIAEQRMAAPPRVARTTSATPGARALNSASSRRNVASATCA
jgi:hypothetical protein